ncbi:MAG: hypothetical protein AUI14_06175 [Actinobacteria bacterium 13_2_20CM_2_71_6]|nr:MAG: hypothetical protein AUI14_06175 [Actinobacteria bacterium 13_2_20CM_2_71_6]
MVPACRSADSGAMTRIRWPYLAVAWSLTYAALGLFWTFGGDGFPFGAADPDPGIRKGMSILGGVRQETAAPVIAVCGLAGAVVALLLAHRRLRHRAGVAVEAIAWTAAAFLGVVLPDYRPLVAVGHLPVLLLGKPFGWPRGVSIAGQLPWPVLNQMLCMLGAVLFAGAALAHRRARIGACPACGRTDTVAGWTTPARAAAWGTRAVWVAAIVPGIYAVTRWAWALGIPLGFGTATLRAMDRENPGIWFGGAALGTMALLGSALTFGLVRRWGETFPRWIPVLGGRRVPVPLAVVPATVVAFLVTSAGLMMTRILLRHPGDASNWAAMGPAVLWPIWGTALATAALAYRYRRRGGCGTCGRG